MNREFFFCDFEFIPFPCNLNDRVPGDSRQNSKPEFTGRKFFFPLFIYPIHKKVHHSSLSHKLITKPQNLIKAFWMQLSRMSDSWRIVRPYFILACSAWISADYWRVTIQAYWLEPGRKIRTYCGCDCIELCTFRFGHA